MATKKTNTKTAKRTPIYREKNIFYGWLLVFSRSVLSVATKFNKWAEKALVKDINN